MKQLKSIDKVKCQCSELEDIWKLLVVIVTMRRAVFVGNTPLYWPVCSTTSSSSKQSRTFNNKFLILFSYKNYQSKL